MAHIMKVFHILRPDVNLNIVDYNLSNCDFVPPGVRICICGVIEGVLLEEVVDWLSLVHVQQHLWE
jgi:hypothetical protein